MYSEKRKEPRETNDNENMTATLLIHAEQPGEQPLESACTIHNATPAGMAIETSASASVGSDLSVKFKLSGLIGEFNIIRLPATVRWITGPNVEGRQMLGIEFRNTMTSTPDRAKWNDFMGHKKSEIF